QRSGYVLDELHLTGCNFLCAVAADGNEIESGVQVDLPRQVAQEQASPLQDSHQDHGLSGKILADLLPHSGHGSGNLLALEKDFHGISFAEGLSHISLW